MVQDPARRSIASDRLLLRPDSPAGKTGGCSTAAARPAAQSGLSVPPHALALTRRSCACARKETPTTGGWAEQRSAAGAVCCRPQACCSGDRHFPAFAWYFTQRMESSRLGRNRVAVCARAIVKACGSGNSGGGRGGCLGRLLILRTFGEFAVDEGGAGADERGEVGAVHGSPAGLC